MVRIGKWRKVRETKMVTRYETRGIESRSNLTIVENKTPRGNTKYFIVANISGRRMERSFFDKKETFDYAQSLMRGYPNG